MDTYEATRVVLSRIQNLDPDNAHKIMGFLLLQEHGEQELIRLAFGPESLLQSVLLKARKELGLVPLSSATGTSSAAPEAAVSPFLLRRISASRLLAATSPSSWAPPSVFSRPNNGVSANGLSMPVDELQSSPELVSPSNLGASPFYGGGDPIDKFFVAPNSFATNPSVGDAIHPDIDCRSPSGNANGMNWETNGYRHRRSSSAADIVLGDSTGVLGWKPCLYFARGYCKNGTACRFLHGPPEEASAALAAGAKTDPVEQQFQDFLLRFKSHRIAGASQFITSSFPCSPTGSVMPSPLSKSLNFWLQHQKNESQRAAAALFLNSRMERSDLITYAGSRQIYLTFPADSTFTEEDVSDYFSIYGPVQDVRIPYQQKRMFGFVTFVYPETVKLIFAKGNPHFVCNSRVLVKPYKEKGKVPDKRQQPPPYEEAYDLQQLGAKTLYSNSNASQEIILRKLEEQRQVAELQRAIELQGRRFTGLQLLDLHNRSFSAPASVNRTTIAAAQSISNVDNNNCGTSSDSSEEAPTEEKSSSAAEPEKANPNEDGHFLESSEHNLPDSPFASATKSSLFKLDVSLSYGGDSTAVDVVNRKSNNNHTSTLMPITSSLDMPSFSSCFLHMPRQIVAISRSSFGHGAIGR